MFTLRHVTAASGAQALTLQRLLALLVFASALIVYAPSFSNGFAYDDVPIILLDDRVRGLDIRGIATEGYWQDPAMGLYRPLTTLSFAIDWTISGGSPTWFHITNAIWHALTTLLLLQLLLKLRISPFPAVFAALVFAVHPVHVEAVANVVGRAELLAAAATLAAAVLWARPPRVARTLPGALMLAVLFVVALLSKESAIMLPVLLVLIDVARGRLRPQRVRKWVSSRWQNLLIMTILLAVYLIARSTVVGGLSPGSLDPSLEVAAPGMHRFFTALQAWPHYLRLLVYPRVLLADYGPRILMPIAAMNVLVMLGAGLLAFCVIGGVIAWTRGRRLTAAALLWFVVAIFPVSNLLVPIGVLVAERTLYIPSVALSLGLASVAAVMIRRVPPPVTAAAAVLLSVVVIAFASRTIVRIPEWENTNSIFAALRRDRPDSFRAAWHFARVAAARNEVTEALRLHGEAIELWPYRRKLIQEAALYASSHGMNARAYRLTSFALGRWPADLTMRRLHAGILLDRGDSASARRHIADGLRWHPRDSLLLRMRRATGDYEGPES